MTGAVSSQLGVAVDPGPLVEGHLYGVCATGFFTLPGMPPTFGSEASGSCEAAAASVKRTASTIDRTKPVVAVTVNGGAPVTRGPLISVRIDYTDNLSFPFPANFVCLRSAVDLATAKAQCDSSTAQAPQYAYDQNCSSSSVPGVGDNARVNVFQCSIEPGPDTPDGPVTFCVISADGAIPDNPLAANQAQPADRANLSASACGSAALDRTSPALSVNLPPVVRAGRPATFSASAQDAIAGLSGDIAWDWGDGSPVSTGMAPAHTFRDVVPSTVTATVSDAAGNVGKASAVVKPTYGPATADGVSGATTTTSAKTLTNAQLLRRAGAGGRLAKLTVGAMTLTLPRRVALHAKGSVVPLRAVIGQVGDVSLSLRIGRRRVAVAGLHIAVPGNVLIGLKVPKGVPAGRARLSVRFTPTGLAPATRGATITLVGHKVRQRAHGARRFGPPAVGGAPAAQLPEGRLPGDS